MLANVYKGTLDIKAPKHNFSPTFVQYDRARLEIELTDNRVPCDLSTAIRVEFTHERPDKTVIIHSGEIVTTDKNQVISYEYQGNEMDTLGKVKTSFAIFNEDNRKLSSPIFEVEIKKDLRAQPFNPAEPNFGLLQTLLDDWEEVKRSGGVPGKKGDPFTYTDFTVAQLEALRGPQGLRGPPGLSGGNGSNVIIDTADSVETIAAKLTSTDDASFVFPRGEYTLSALNFLVSKKISITKPIKITGDNAIIYLERGVQIELLSPGIEISGIDFRIRNHGTLVGQEAILIVSRSDIKIDNCKFSGSTFYYGIYIGDDIMKKCDDVSITNSQFSNLAYGVLKQYGAGCSAHRLLIDRCRFTNMSRGDAIELNIGWDVGYMISHNYIDGVASGGIGNAGIGIGIAGGIYDGNKLEQTRDGYVINNIIKNTARSAIHLEACNNFKIVGNILEKSTGDTPTTGFGISMWGCTDMIVESNQVKGFRCGISDDVGVYGSSYIVSTDNNQVTKNNISDCVEGVMLGAVGESRTQYCKDNTIKNCGTGVHVWGKAIFTISDNLLEDCETPLNINYEPTGKASIFPNKNRHITITNNKTKFRGLLSDKFKNKITLSNYDSVDFEGNNFVLGSFARKPKTFVSNDQPLYFVKGDVLITINTDNTVTKKLAVSDGFNPTAATDSFYFKCTAGKDYIVAVYPTHPGASFKIGHVLSLKGVGANGANLISMITRIATEEGEYRVYLTDVVSATITTSTEFGVNQKAIFVDY